MLRRVLVGAVLTTLVAGLTALSPPAASADVITSRPPAKKCVGKKIRVGVWYQSYSGGPRGVRIRVVGPRGKTVLKKNVRAKTRWRYWGVKLKRRGVYRTIYRQGRHGKPKWRQAFRTRVRRC